MNLLIKAFEEWTWIFTQFAGISYDLHENKKLHEIESFPSSKPFFYWVDESNIKVTQRGGTISGSTHNEDVKGYIQRAIKAYEKEGEDGLVKQIIKNENKTEAQRYYLDNPEAITTGKKLAIMDLPSGTSFENAVKVYQQGEYARKHGGRVMNDPNKNYNAQRFI